MSISKQELLTSIEEKRSSMIQIALNCGFKSNAAIKQSQELDHLLNLYYDLTIRSDKKESSSC
ncbi:Spo0E family sporulation regulatory protein-aspartic acid phosphatase [Anaerobacillus sp. MEB173]|uniref:Spo0E family sporulation regulatory protein-aspartic acid phosphatase n=1 Tax=Anaerobacillus sp. MEB173 TaxID=3383345 RepID=UPI003F8FFD95